MIVWDESLIPEESREAFDRWLDHVRRHIAGEMRERCAKAVEDHGRWHQWVGAHTDCARVIRSLPLE